MYTVKIQAATLKAAEAMKAALIDMNPMLDGLVSITCEPPITTLDKVIEEMERKQ